ncbi:MAG: nitrophenyl compound nitroreductase subunit ArsF family protein [Bacteroidales bacterium]|nr:nitrophenyl compound nitroreductase subunit ArsF family protein [Bacteroidales bacterium]MCF8333373.1 nitrophenyl compound nitroreductase subunit ArsF family protein [Bacteroidales bacterium]
MKSTRLLILFLFAGMISSCHAQTSPDDQKQEVSAAENVNVYYFHLTRRCATCKAVEKVSREAVEEMEKENVTFTDYNIEKKEGKARAEQMDVSGQSLLISDGAQKINLTQKGFMYARTKPEKLKALVKKEIKGLL